MSEQPLLENECTVESHQFSIWHLGWQWWITTTNPKWLQSSLSRRDLAEPVVLMAFLPGLFLDMSRCLKNDGIGPREVILDVICMCSLLGTIRHLSKKSLKYDVMVSLVMLCGTITQAHLGKDLEISLYWIGAIAFGMGIHSVFIVFVETSFLFAIFIFDYVKSGHVQAALFVSMLAIITEYRSAVATLKIYWAEEVLMGAKHASLPKVDDKHLFGFPLSCFPQSVVQKVSTTVVPVVEQASYPHPFHLRVQPQDFRICSTCFGVEDANGRDAMASETDRTAESFDSTLFAIARDCHLAFGLDEIFMGEVARQVVADAGQILRQINMENTYEGRRRAARSRIQDYQSGILRELHHNISSLCAGGKLEKMVNYRRYDSEYNTEQEEAVSRAKALLVEDIVNAHRVFLRGQAVFNRSGSFGALTVVCRFLGRPDFLIDHNILRRLPCAMAMAAMRAEFEGPPTECSSY